MKIGGSASFHSAFTSEEKIINFAKLDWKQQKTSQLQAGTILHHGNRSGEDGGAGQTGLSGDPIWLTSSNDTNAAHGYSGGKYLLRYEVTEDLKLAVMDSFDNQVFGDEIEDWKDAREAFGLDGVLTDYGTTQEICLFDRSKIRFIDTITLSDK